MSEVDFDPIEWREFLPGVYCRRDDARVICFKCEEEKKEQKEEKKEEKKDHLSKCSKCAPERPS